MSVRRKTVLNGRITLFRQCDICGKNIITTSDTPFVRSVPKNGRQLICYYCSENCKRASYKHIGWWDGKTEERKRERDAKRDRGNYYKERYAAHAEELREKRREYVRTHPEQIAADNAYYRRKRKLMNEG